MNIYFKTTGYFFYVLTRGYFGVGIVNQNQQRYFDSPTMITLDDDDDDDYIPLSRCSNRISIPAAAEPSLNETDLSDLLIFTNRKFKIISI